VFLLKDPMITAKAVMDSLLEHAAGVESLAVLSRFRLDFHGCLIARADELAELADAVLCTEGAGAHAGRAVAGPGAPAGSRSVV
jgi:hypothetical protein